MGLSVVDQVGKSESVETNALLVFSLTKKTTTQSYTLMQAIGAHLRNGPYKCTFRLHLNITPSVSASMCICDVYALICSCGQDFE